MRSLLIVFCSLTLVEGYGQVTFYSDSLLQTQYYVVDSVNVGTAKNCEVLKNQYDSIEQHYNSITLSLQNRVDSLTKINVPTSKFARRMRGCLCHLQSRQ